MMSAHATLTIRMILLSSPGLDSGLYFIIGLKDIYNVA